MSRNDIINTDGSLNFDNLGSLPDKIGDLSQLNTTDKSSLVNAVNNNVAQLADIVKINVRQPPYNAKADGTSDDTSAINSAIAYANNLVANGTRCSLYMPSGSGSYVVSGALTMLSNFVGVHGDEATTTIAPTHNGNVFVLQGRGHHIRKIRIKGKTRNDSDVANYSSQVGIFNQNSPFYNCIFEELDISVGGIGIYGKFNTGSYFYNNTIRNSILNDNGMYGIKLESSDPNSVWMNCNLFERFDCESNGKGGIMITGFQSEENNAFKLINLDGNGSLYKTSTDEKFGLYDDTATTLYNNIYEQLYFEGLNVPSTDNIDSNYKVGGLILNNFNTLKISSCVFASNTRDMLFVTSGGKIGNAIIELGMVGSNASGINKKSPIQIKGAGAQTFDVKINLTYGLGTLSLYDVDTAFVGKIINPYDIKYRYTREDVSTTQKVFAVKIASKTTDSYNVFNHSFSVKLTFDHDNNYNQQSLYGEYAVANTTVSQIKNIRSGGGTLNIYFLQDASNIYLFVEIYGIETYPYLKLFFDGLYNDKNIVSVPSNTLVASYSGATPTWKSGITQITLS